MLVKVFRTFFEFHFEFVLDCRNCTVLNQNNFRPNQNEKEPTPNATSC